MRKVSLLLFILFLFSLVVAGPVTPVLAASANLIANPSAETATNGQPVDWQTDKWGTNTTTLTYKKNSAQSGSRSLYANTTQYTSGDAKWFFKPVAIKPGTTYTFSDYYKSSIRTEILARYTGINGDDTYVWLAGAAKSANTWKKSSVTFVTPANVKTMTILHILDAKGTLQTDNFSLTEKAVAAPAIALTAPGNGTTVSGTVVLRANPTASEPIAGVQFMLDGGIAGDEVTSAPYQADWNTKTALNGQHTLTARVRTASGAIATSAPVQINVDNVAPAGGANLVPNPSAEAALDNLPTHWQTNRSHTNTAAFSYMNTGHNSGHSLKTEISSYTNGDAFWSYGAQPVTGGALYEFSDWYQSNVDTEVYAEITMQDGSQQWLFIGTAWHSNGWNRFYQQFTLPRGAVYAQVYHTLFAVGYLVTDDYKFSQYQPVGFNEGMVSITFDDALRSTYTYGLPLLQQYGLVSTQYMLSGYTNDPYYMNIDMMKAFKDAGHEIASHTVTHPELIKNTAAQLQTELAQSKSDLQHMLGVTPTDFASPHGEYNAEVLDVIRQNYRSHRSVDVGFNSKDNFDIYNIKVQNVVISTKVEDIAAWVARAKAEHTWLVLVYHAVDPAPAVDELWNTPPADLDAQFHAIKQSGITVKTVSQALDALLPQL